MLNKSSKKILSIILLIIIATFLYLSYSYIHTKLNNKQVTGYITEVTDKRHSAPSDTASVEYKVETVAENLNVPWSIVFTSPNRILVTERVGNIKIIENGVTLDTPLITFPEVSSLGEEGLMGLVLDPDYEQNKLIYASYAFNSGNTIKVRIVQLVDDGSKASIKKTVLDNIPAASLHAGSRIKFGPDNKLYITTGDSFQRQLAQNPESPAGKILRINSDGSIPTDNPFPNSPIWSYGHRNPQGIDWNPLTGDLWETEHGPSGSDGPQGGDEVNIIQKGGNYGWPIVSHDKSAEGMISPIKVFTPAEAPASGLFYTHDLIPQFKNNFFFGALRGEGIIRIILSGSDSTKIEKTEKIFHSEYGRIRDVVQGPDGAIYFSTSNRDGRGNPSRGDDRILRIVPK